MKIPAICIIAIALTGCQHVKLHGFPHATAASLIGTWKQVGSAVPGKAIVTFRQDGTYCAYENQESGQPFSLGTWNIDAGGSLGIQIVQSRNAADITSPNVSLIQQTFVTSSSTIVMGPVCPHCQDGIAGIEYRRAAAKAASCGAP